MIIRIYRKVFTEKGNIAVEERACPKSSSPSIISLTRNEDRFNNIIGNVRIFLSRNH